MVLLTMQKNQKCLVNNNVMLMHVFLSCRSIKIFIKISLKEVYKRMSNSSDLIHSKSLFGR